MKNRKATVVTFRKPKINISVSDLPTLTKAAWDALRRRNNPTYLFNYGGSPQRLEYDFAGQKILVLLDIYRFRFEAARAADWVKIGIKGMEFPTPPPLDVIRDMQASPDIPLPRLRRLLEIPVYSSDGSLVVVPGYHQASQIFLAPPENLVIPAIPNSPTEADVSRARADS